MVLKASSLRKHNQIVFRHRGLLSDAKSVGSRHRGSISDAKSVEKEIYSK